MAIARAQTPVSAAGAATSATIAATFGSAVTAGNLIVTFVACDSTGTPTITPSSTGSPAGWVTLTPANDAGSVIRYTIAYLENAPGGSTTVTATFSGTQANRSIHIVEYSGVLTSGSLDQNTAGHSTAAVTNPTDNAMVTTQNGDLIVSALVYRSATTPASAGSGFTLVGDDSTVVHWAAEDQIQTNAGSIAAAFTVTGGSLASGIMSAAFLPAAAAGGVQLGMVGRPRIPT